MPLFDPVETILPSRTFITKFGPKYVVKYRNDDFRLRLI